MNIKPGEIFGIKNINNTSKNEIISSVIEGKVTPVEHKNNIAKIQIKAQDSKIRAIMNQIKKIETDYSVNQIYIESLKKAKGYISSYTNINNIYNTLINLSKNTKFNNKLLLKAIIPQDINFYRSVKNINQLKEKISKEIRDTESKQRKLIQQLNIANIALENINAAKIKSNLQQLSRIKLGNKEIYNKLNHQIIISLIK